MPKLQQKKNFCGMGKKTTQIILLNWTELHLRTFLSLFFLTQNRLHIETHFMVFTSILFKSLPYKTPHNFYYHAVFYCHRTTQTRFCTRLPYTWCIFTIFFKSNKFCIFMLLSNTSFVRCTSVQIPCTRNTCLKMIEINCRRYVWCYRHMCLEIFALHRTQVVIKSS